MAPIPVIDPVTVADVEALLAAIPPDRELYEPVKYRWENWVELPCVDFAGDQADDGVGVGWQVRGLGSGSMRGSNDERVAISPPS